MTAHDFEWSFRRLVNPDAGNIFAYFYYPIKGARAFNTGQTDDASVVGVRAVDDRTLVIETEEPCSYFPYILTFFTSVPAPRWQVEKYGIRWSEPEHLVSNSTWRLASWVRNIGMNYALNPHYNGPWKGYLERLEFTFILPGWRGLPAYENNELARRRLAEAGYPGGKGLPTLELWVRGQPPTPDKWNVVVAMQQMFQEHLDIKVNLRQQSANAFNAFMRNHEIPWGFLWFNMDYPDPSDRRWNGFAPSFASLYIGEPGDGETRR